VPGDAVTEISIVDKLSERPQIFLSNFGGLCQDHLHTSFHVDVSGIYEECPINIIFHSPLSKWLTVAASGSVQVGRPVCVYTMAIYCICDGTKSVKSVRNDSNVNQVLRAWIKLRAFIILGCDKVRCAILLERPQKCYMFHGNRTS